MACLVEEQEETSESDDTNTSVDWAMNATTTTDIGPTNKVAAHWARKNQQPDDSQDGHTRYRRYIRCSPGGGRGVFRRHRRILHKNIHVPGQADEQGNKKMLTKHNLRPAARKMNIIPGLHSTLISIPKLADAGYT